MECPKCFFVAAPGQMAEEGTCPNCGERPERDQPSGASTDFQAFGMPDPGEDDGNQGNPLGVGSIMGKDGERGFKNRDNFMSHRQTMTPPLWFAASEMEDEEFIPMSQVDVLEEDEVPEKRKDRKLKNIEAMEKEAIAPALIAGAGLLGRAVAPMVARAAAPALGAAAKKFAPRFLAFQGAKGLLGGLLGGGGGQGTPDTRQPVRPPSYYSFHQQLTADFNPGGLDKIPAEDSSDPEKVDPKEYNDGEREPLQVGLDVNDGGGTDQGLDENGEAVHLFATNLPEILNGFFDENPVDLENDPIFSRLHAALEHERPGYLDEDHDDSLIEQFLEALFNDVEGQPHDPMQETPNDEAVENKESRTALQQPGLQIPGLTTLRPEDVQDQSQAMQGRCGLCGGTISPSDPACPQCGGGNPSTLHQPVAKSASPYPPINRVNMADRIPAMYESVDIPPDMDIEEWNRSGRPIWCDVCANPTVDRESRACKLCGQVKEAKVAADTQGPNTDEQKAVVAEFLQSQGRGDEIPDMILNPSQYADELAEVIGRDDPPDAVEQPAMPDPAQMAAPPGATMPVPSPAPPGMGPGMGGGGMPAMARAIQRHAQNPDHFRHLQEHGDHFDNDLAISPADQVHPEDSSLEQDSGHPWVDESGDPLKVGQEYEMFSANYDIPDLVRIEAVKPDSIEYTLTGEYGLEHSTEITREEAQLENLTFSPASDGHQDVIEQTGDDRFEAEDMEDVNRPAPGMDQTDLSTPHQMAASTSREWLREGGAKFTPTEQREYIEEAGEARNRSKLDLSGTHYEIESHTQSLDDYFLFGL